MVSWFHGKQIQGFCSEIYNMRIAFVRLENQNDNHNKFYEMLIAQENMGRCDVVIHYGRIGTQGKTIYLRGADLPHGDAHEISLQTAKRAFLEQLKKKFKDKEYTLIDLTTNDKSLKVEIEELQCQFEDFSKVAVRLEDRGF